MAIPLLYTLNRSARAVYPFVVRGVREGLSQRAIGDVIRRVEGLRISSATLSTLHRAVKSVYERGGRLQFLNYGKRPNVASLPIALTRQKRQQSYLIKVTGWSQTAQQPIETWLTYLTDKAPLREEVESWAMDTVEDNLDLYDLQDVRASLWSGTRAAGPEWLTQ